MVNNWLLAQLADVLQCAAMSAVCLFCEHSCFSKVALLVVTISFVIAANIMTLKLFNTAMGRPQPVQKRARVARAYENLTENHGMP